MKRKANFLVALGLLVLAVANASATEAFVHLKGARLHDFISGSEFTDEVHWSYKFAKDGAVTWFDLGRERKGNWLIQENKFLCIDYLERTKKARNCYELWVKGNKLELRQYGQTIMEGRAFR